MLSRTLFPSVRAIAELFDLGSSDLGARNKSQSICLAQLSYENTLINAKHINRKDLMI